MAKKVKKNDTTTTDLPAIESDTATPTASMQGAGDPQPPAVAPIAADENKIVTAADLIAAIKGNLAALLALIPDAHPNAKESSIATYANAAIRHAEDWLERVKAAK